ncbi:MAG: hypothetical protein AB9836_06045 [Aminipila sp.]
MLKSSGKEQLPLVKVIKDRTEVQQMAAILETIFAGGIIFQRKIGRKANRKGETKSPKNNPTSEEVEKINARYSERTLQIKLHHNFKPGDHHLVYTYHGRIPTQAEAKEDLKKMKRELRKECKKRGIPFKWIAVTEYQNKRIHHHMVMNNGVPLEVIRELWGKGTVHERPLSKSGDWRELGTYLIKETSKTFRNPDAPGRLRYSCSRNLTMPEVFKEEIGATELLDDPQPVTGYYIDSDSIYKGINPVTERPYIEYVMLPLNIYKTRKRFNNTKKSKYKSESYYGWTKKNAPRQLEIDIPF